MAEQQDNIFSKIRQEITLERVMLLYGISLKTGLGERQSIEHESLYVNEYKGVYSWYSSGDGHEAGEGGDVFTWVQKRENLDVKGAAEWICRKLKRWPI